MNGNISWRKNWGLTNLKAFDLLLFVVWGYGIITLYANVIMCRIIGISIDKSPLLTIVIVTLIIASLPYLLKYLKLFDFVLYGAIVALYFSQAAIYMNNAPFLNQMSERFFLYCLPYYGLYKCINVEKSFRMFRFMAIVSIIVDALQFLLLGGANKYDLASEGAHGMTMAYSLLPHVLIMLWTCFKQKTFFDIAITALGVLLLLSMGTRGPILCVFVFVIGYCFMFGEFKKPRRTKISVFILGGVCYLLLEPLLFVVTLIISKFGMSSRVVSMMLNNSLNDSNGRDAIQEIVLDYVNSGPFWGYGLAGDRVMLSGIWSDGGFSHNLVVEMMASFGRIPGLVICVMIALYIIYVIRHSYNRINSIFFWMLVSICVSELVSGSFLQDPVLYMMFGFGANILSTKGASNNSNCSILYS